MDKRDLIAAKHVDHVVLLASFLLILLLPAILMAFDDDVLHELKNLVSSLRGRLELTRMKGAGADGSFALAASELDRLPEGAALPMDPEIFSRLVRILVDNALDFSPPGAGAAVFASAGDDFVVVRVADRGPGVPPNLREWIFGRFAGTRKNGSEPHTGLGLAIARSLVSRIGSGDRRASIGVEDNPGGGAVFVLKLPLADRHS